MKNYIFCNYRSRLVTYQNNIFLKSVSCYCAYVCKPTNLYDVSIYLFLKYEKSVIDMRTCPKLSLFICFKVQETMFRTHFMTRKCASYILYYSLSHTNSLFNTVILDPFMQCLLKSRLRKFIRCTAQK